MFVFFQVCVVVSRKGNNVSVCKKTSVQHSSLTSVSRQLETLGKVYIGILESLQVQGSQIVWIVLDFGLPRNWLCLTEAKN